MIYAITLVTIGLLFLARKANQWCTLTVLGVRRTFVGPKKVNIWRVFAVIWIECTYLLVCMLIIMMYAQKVGGMLQ